MMDEQLRAKVLMQKDPIDRVYHERIFKLFREYCHDNELSFTWDLVEFDFSVLASMMGIGEKKLRLIKERWIQYLEDLSADESYLKEIGLNTAEVCQYGSIDRGLLLEIISETIGPEIPLLLTEMREGSAQKPDQLRAVISCFSDWSFQGDDDAAWLILTETIVQLFGRLLDNAIFVENMRKRLLAGSHDVKEAVRDFLGYYVFTRKACVAFEALKTASASVHPSNYNLAVSCLRIVGAKKDLLSWLESRGVNTIGEACQINISFIADLKDNQDYFIRDLAAVLSKCEMNLIQQFVDSFREFFTTRERAYDVLLKRAEGKTLDQVGQVLGLTRERVRQIELVTVKRLISFYSQFIELLVSILKGKGIMATEEPKCIFESENDEEVLLYSLKKANLERIQFLEELDTLIVDIDVNRFRNILNSIIEEKIPDVWTVDDGWEEIEGILKEEQIYIDYPLFLKFLKYIGFKKIGKHLVRKGFSKSDMYRYIIFGHFQEGIKVYDEEEIGVLKALLTKEFGDVELPDDRAIAARIIDFCIICDRGKYILPEYVQIGEQLINDIRKYIKNTPRNNILIAEIFEHYRLRLLSESNISNDYFLFGVLKDHLEGEFTFFRDTISKTKSVAGNTYKDLQDFLLSRGEPATKYEIREAIPGISDIKISNAVLYCKDIIYWDTNSFAHIGIFNMIPSLQQELMTILERSLDEFDGYCNMNIIFAITRQTMPDFLRNNGIRNPVNLYYILEFLFGEIFEFARPHIWRRTGGGRLTVSDLIMSFVSKKCGVFTEREFNEWVVKYGLSSISSRAALNELVDNQLLRLDRDRFVTANDPRFGDEFINAVRIELETQINGKEYLPIREINDFGYFPASPGIEWNSFLLQSVIRKFVNDFRIIEKGFTDYRFVESAIVRASSPIKDFVSLIEFIIYYELRNEPSLTIEKLTDYLHDRNLLVLTEIPRAILESKRLIVDDQGMIHVDEPPGQGTINRRNG